MKKIISLVLAGIYILTASGCGKQPDIQEEEMGKENEMIAQENNYSGWGAIDDLYVEKAQKGILGSTAVKEIPRDVYYDKALAGVLGHLAGLTTGFEFIKVAHPASNRLGAPLSILKDITYGPYGGGDHYNGWDGKAVSVGENRLWKEGQLASDDDLHMDIFNQTMIDENIDTYCRLLQTEFADENVRKEAYLSIKSAWLKYGVSDWGGGDRAMYLMSKYPEDDNYAPPFVGTWEAGNLFHWCTEAYIENETLGILLPGMPQSAAKLGNIMGSTTGDGEALMLAEYWSAMYAAAFFEDSSIDTLRKTANGILPKNSWLYTIYQKCEELFEQYPDPNPLNDEEDTNWRKAANELGKTVKDYYDIDDLGCAADLNFGLSVLAILYGNNDYYTTGMLSGVMGADSDCYTAAVLGIMGIIKGMEGTPDIVKERIYQDGEGIYINDKGFTPHIMNDYPETQKITDIVKLYQKNAERFIAARGGNIDDGIYRIASEEFLRPEAVILDNYDFESGSLKHWKHSEDQTIQVLAETAGVYNPEDPSTYEKTIANSGAYRGTVKITEETKDAALYMELDDLEPGEVYKVTAYITGENSRVQLFAENSELVYKEVVPTENPEVFSGYWGVSTGWYLREIYFIATEKATRIGLKVSGK
ncbi:hypothetical protein HNQ56_001448 [Anaerotaenia torta]|uniref:ADP-ribosylglycohydrolase family protein n=1 Tax=Anaerotaenia torta TaxID=433293 RepID=UPI003D1B78A6